MPVFSPEINWIDPLLEELEFETPITRFRADTEQRQANRLTPHRKFSYLISALDPQEGALLEALVYGGQGIEWTVPYWRSSRYLPVARSAGNTTLAHDTTWLGYEIGESVLFWRSAYEYEASVLSNVSDTTLTFAALVANWSLSAPRPQVMPAFQALISPSMSADYVSKEFKTVRVEFDLKVEAYGD